MDSVIRGLVIYFFLLVIFRLGGKRTLYDATLFDFVLLLIIAETTQQALLGDDFSITNAVILITTLILTDIGISLVKQYWKGFEKAMDNVPLIVLEHGKPLKDRLNKARIDEEDILESARKMHGLTMFSQIKYAILEKDGTISIIPEQGYPAHSSAPETPLPA